jgi:N-glycosylase/DNA lyase
MNDGLRELEAAVDHALATGDVSRLEVVGYGEITLVVRWTVAGRQVACKRLPGLAGDTAFSAYRSCVTSYVARLAERGVVVPETAVEAVPRRDGSVTAYCVQPVLPAPSLLPNLLQGASRDEVREVVAALVERIAGCIDARIGLDAQLSNWAWADDGLRYLDISTPFERDERGRESFDVELHLASVPWALRGGVRRFALGAILDKYYDRRGALIDLAGNLYKERLAQLVPAVLEAANRLVEPPITAAEAERYYRDDARMWELLQRLRRADRWWQRTVRRRPYPFLLPGRIER